MHRGLTGQYHVTQVVGETIRAFAPLAPDPLLAFSAGNHRPAQRKYRA